MKIETVSLSETWQKIRFYFLTLRIVVFVYSSYHMNVTTQNRSARVELDDILVNNHIYKTYGRIVNLIMINFRI